MLTKTDSRDKLKMVKPNATFLLRNASLSILNTSCSFLNTSLSSLGTSFSFLETQHFGVNLSELTQESVENTSIGPRSLRTFYILNKNA